MLTRLLVLAAALAALFVFVPASSAGEGGGTLEECQDLNTGEELADCLAALPVDVLPDECESFVGEGAAALTGVDLGSLTSIAGVAGLTECIDAIIGLGGETEEPAGETDEGDEGDEGYDDGYGYDGYGGLGYGGDGGAVPEGGVDSGIGPTGSDEPGAPLAARGAALIALLGVLTTGLVMMRRRHGS